MRWLILLKALAVAVVTLLACAVPTQAADRWVVGVYMCGSDLESKWGAGTADIQEMLNARLSPDVRVLLQTGGAVVWRNQVMHSGEIGRWLVDSQGLHQQALLPDADMGSRSTLTDFLRALAEQPAEHRMLVLWNHGGGSATGVCFDERTRRSLSLADLRSALTAVFSVDAGAPPFEIIGADACLMGSYEFAAAMQGLARFAVASEEWEPGGGWQYTAWLTKLSANPTMDGAALGRVIADAYLQDCVDTGTSEMATLSVVDCARLSAVTDAVTALGNEALANTEQNPNAYAAALRTARTAENYGGNTPQQGYANMVDLVGLANGSAVAGQVSVAVDNAVVHRVNGALRARGHGLSVYFPLGGPAAMTQRYAAGGSLGAQTPLTKVYAQWTSPVAGRSAGVGSLAALDGCPVYVHGQRVTASLLPVQLAQVVDASCALVYIAADQHMMLHLGSDPRADVDLNEGVVTDRMRPTWPALNGHPLHVELAAPGLLSSPAVVNGERVNLLLKAVDYGYVLLGARRPVDDGLVDRGVRPLVAGDEVALVHRVAPISGDGGFEDVELDTFTLGGPPTITQPPLEDGLYALCLEFHGVNGQIARSAPATYRVTDGAVSVDALAN